MARQFQNPGPQTFTEAVSNFGVEDAGGAFLKVPLDVEKMYGVKGRIPVTAKFSKATSAASTKHSGKVSNYTGSVCKMGLPFYMLIVCKANRQEIGVGIGDLVTCTITLDDGERVVDVPADLADALADAAPAGWTPKSCTGTSKSNFTLLDVFKCQSYTCQKEYCNAIIDAKRDETRAKRISDCKSKMMAKCGASTVASSSSSSSSSSAASLSSAAAPTAVASSASVSAARKPAKKAAGKAVVKRAPVAAMKRSVKGTAAARVSKPKRDR